MIAPVTQKHTQHLKYPYSHLYFLPKSKVNKEKKNLSKYSCAGEK